jgi:hypothetical protein
MNLMKKIYGKGAHAPSPNHPTQRAPDGWDSARFLEIVLNYGTPLRGSPFPSLALPAAGNASRWAALPLQR